MGIINTVIGVPLGYLMRLCYQICAGNYGLAIILFTVFTKVILLPVNIWVQRNSIKMIKLQPEVNEIIARFAGNRDKAAEEQMALYKKAHYHPMLNMVPLLIQIPIILGLIAVVYNPLQHLLHLAPETITELANYLGVKDTGQNFHLLLIERINEGVVIPQSLAYSDMTAAVNAIQGMNLDFFGLNLAHAPSFTSFDLYWLFPAASGVSAWLLCVFQNRDNVLQKEQGFLGKWGMAIFLVAFSTYFAFIVAAGVGLYWVIGNLLGIAMIYLMNAMYNPKKYIDYDALERSKVLVAMSKKVERDRKRTKEQKARSKADYKRFNDDSNVKQLVYYSERSGFYKYFEDQIQYILDNSDIVLHYLTSDPDDVIFTLDNPRIIPYFVDDNRLVPLFMMMNTDVMVCTTMNLQTYHLKRSLLRKDAEYIYTPHDPVSIHMASPLGCVDHFDTVLCVGQYQIDEIRETERVYDLPEKTLVPCGYALMDRLIAAYEGMEKADNPVKKLLIAPSWQEDNILDSCIDDLLGALLGKGYDITVRPHPEYVKRYGVRMQMLTERYEDRFDECFRIETDFSSNVTIFTADLVITDWSGIAYEFAYATKKPVLFVNTQLKVMNPEYVKIGIEPMEVTLRSRVGIEMEKDEAARADEKVAALLDSGDAYREAIGKVMEDYLFNQGHSAEVAGQYIIDAVTKKAAAPRVYG